MASEVLIVPTLSIPDYTFRVTLDDVAYNLRIRWNTRAEAWFLDIFDADNNALANGRPCLIDQKLLAQLRHIDGMPPGEFLPFDTTETAVDPGLNDFGTRCLLTYTTVGET